MSLIKNSFVFQAIKRNIVICLLCFVTIFLCFAIIFMSMSLRNNDYVKDYPFLWSKRVLDLDNYNLLKTEKIASENVIKNHIKNASDVIWIRNTSKGNNTLTDLNILGDHLDLIKTPVVLVTSDGDRPVPSSYNKDLVNKLLSSSKITKWYTQNYDGSIVNPKLGFYPIGLDMHTKKWLKQSTVLDFFRTNKKLRQMKFQYILDVRKQHKGTKINRIYSDTHLSKTHSRRRELYNNLKYNKLIVFQDHRVKYKEVYNKYAEHRFVLSPRGNGLDCHRTWEVMLLGSIVITESSSLDKMFTDNNLPVIILKNFEELNNITSEQLDRWYEENKHKTSLGNILSKFRPEYWINK